MQQIRPGVWHWTTFHEGIGATVHSCYVEATDPAFVIDPREPEQGLGWFERHVPPAAAYLTNRHHYRHSDRFAERFGLEVRCHEAGLHEFVRGEAVRPFAHGDVLPGGVRALKIGALCPEETAFFIPVGNGVIALGDAVIREDGKLSFVPDFLMDDPMGVKRGLLRSLKRLLGRRFDTLVLAHGAPWVGGAHAALAAFLHDASLPATRPRP